MSEDNTESKPNTNEVLQENLREFLKKGDKAVIAPLLNQKDVLLQDVAKQNSEAEPDET